MSSDREKLRGSQIVAIPEFSHYNCEGSKLNLNRKGSDISDSIANCMN